MAGPNDQTKAILAKLENEGLLLRNKGTNSIKSVKVELAKFAGTFEALSGAMQGITGTVQGQTELQKLRDEREAKLELLNEKDREEYEKMEADEIKRKKKLDMRTLAMNEKAMKDRETRDFKVFGKDGIFASTLKNTFNFLKKALFFGIVGAIGYEVLAGAVEALAPKIFGKDVNLPTLFEGFEKAGKAFSTIGTAEWEGLAANIKALSDPAIKIGLGFAAAKGTQLAVQAGVDVASNALTFAAIRKMMTPTVEDVDGGLKKAGLSKKLIRGGIAGLVFGGLFAAMDPILNFVRAESENMSPEDIESTEIPTGMQVGALAGIASIAMLFVPGGLVARAIAGLGMFLIGGAIKMVDYYKDDDKLPNKIEEVYAANKKSTDDLNRLLDLRKQALQLGADPEEIERQIKELRAKIKEDRENFLATFQESIPEDMQSIIRAESSLVNLLEDPEAYRKRNLYEGGMHGLGKKRTDEELDEMYDAELTRLRNIVTLNRSQLDETVAFGQEKLGMSYEDMGVVEYDGKIVTIAEAERLKAEANDAKKARENKELARQQEINFAEYKKKYGIESDMTYAQFLMEAYKENSSKINLGGESLINIISAPQTPVSLMLNQGGSTTNTSILQKYHSGGYAAGASCPFPGLALN